MSGSNPAPPAGPTGRVDTTSIVNSLQALNQASGNDASIITEAVAEVGTGNATTPPVVYVEGYATPGDGGEGYFWYDANDTSSSDNGGTIIVDAAGRRWHRLANDQPVNILWFGADPTGATDSHAAIQAAVNLGRPVYMPTPSAYYLVNNQITISTYGQVIFGDGMNETVIQIKTTFSGTAIGVFVDLTATGQDSNIEFRDFKVTFEQPTTATTVGALNTYPPAFFIEARPRVKIRRVRVTLALVCVEMIFNCGGAVIEDCEFSAFVKHIWIDGAEDTMKIDKCQIYNFDMSSDNLEIFYSAACLGLYSGRCDGLQLSDSLFICGTNAEFFNGSISGLTGPTFGFITGTGFDTNSGITMSAGNLQVSACYFTQANASNYAITASGGNIELAACYFSADATLSGPQVNLIGSSAVFFSASGCYFNNVGNVLAIGTTNAGQEVVATVTGCQFEQPVSEARSVAIVNVGVGTRINITANYFTDAGGGTGDALYIAQDDQHIAVGNQFNGWSFTSPVAPTSLASALATSLVAMANSGDASFNTNLTHSPFAPFAINGSNAGVYWNDANNGFALTQTAAVGGGNGLAIFLETTDTNYEVFSQSSVQTGSIYSPDGATTVYATSSDRRIKTTRGPSDGSLIDRLTFYTGSYNVAPTVERTVLIADELQKEAPWLVRGAPDAVDQRGKVLPQMVDLMGLVPEIGAKVQTMQARINAQDKLIADLTAEVQKLVGAPKPA